MDELINYGGGIKSLEDNKIGGYLVLFSDEKATDLAGDFFTKDTDFGFEDSMKTPVWFHHRKPLKTKDGVKTITVKEKIGEGTLTKDENGILIEAILYNRKQYEKALAAMGWSSGTSAHTTEREKKGKASYVKQWYLGHDASVTPMPAEPRTAVTSLKSIDNGFASDFIIEGDELKAVDKVPGMKGIFADKLAEEQLNFWRLENALMKTFKDIANAAASEEITGTAVDYAALVTEAVAEFGIRIAPMVVKQIADWLEQEHRENFYLKSTFLDAIISEASPVKQRFEDRLDTVLAAVERVATDAKDIHEMRQSQKAGRKISTARMTKLKDMHKWLGDLIVEVEGEEMPADEKSVDPQIINGLVAQLDQIKTARLLRAPGGKHNG
jgi:hypothetical protein